MTVEDRLKYLDPRHHRFVQLPDVWHVSAFADNEVVMAAFREYRYQQPAGADGIRVGPQSLVWYSVDGAGNLLQEWGCDHPPILPQSKPWPWEVQ